MSVIQMCLSGLFRGWLGDLAARVLNETNLIPTNATRTFKENLATSYVMIKGNIHLVHTAAPTPKMLKVIWSQMVPSSRLEHKVYKGKLEVI